MTDGNVGADLPLGSGGDAYGVGRGAVNGEGCKQAAQRRTCDEKRRQGKNHPHGAPQSDDEAQPERGTVSGARPSGHAGYSSQATTATKWCISAKVSAIQRNSAPRGHDVG